MQRIYFGDTENFFIEDFQLADDVERLPDSRFKIPIGARLNYYLSDRFVLRSYYRFYTDNWGIRSHTVNLEVPVKLSDKFTLYPSYRYYTQTEANYFYQKENALSTFDFIHQIMTYLHMMLINTEWEYVTKIFSQMQRSLLLV